MDYYHKLYKIFLSSLGMDNDEEILTDKFYKWLPIYMEETREYRKYLKNYMGIDLNSENLAELNKGYIDSVIGNKPIMISDYAFTKGYENSKLVIDEDDSILLLKNKDLSKIENIDLFIMHNPYSMEEFTLIENLLNVFEKEILVGMYGNINDCDRKEKIDYLNKLKNNALNIEFDYNEKNNNYFYVLTKK